jgi:hypothetical protein
MKIRLLWPFIKWLTRSTIDTIAERHEFFKRGLRKDPTEAICMYIIVSMLMSIVVVLGTIWLLPPDLVTITLKSWALYLILYLAAAVVSNLFEVFRKERSDLFNTIRDGQR